MATIKMIMSSIYINSHPNALTIISSSYKYSSPHARSPVWFSRGIGLSGTGLPKKLHTGSQPSFKFQTSKFSEGIVAFTLALWASYLEKLDLLHELWIWLPLLHSRFRCFDSVDNRFNWPAFHHHCWIRELSKNSGV